MNLNIHPETAQSRGHNVCLLEEHETRLIQSALKLFSVRPHIASPNQHKRSLYVWKMFCCEVL